MGSDTKKSKVSEAILPCQTTLVNKPDFAWIDARFEEMTKKKPGEGKAWKSSPLSLEAKK